MCRIIISVRKIRNKKIRKKENFLEGEDKKYKNIHKIYVYYVFIY